MVRTQYLGGDGGGWVGEAGRGESFFSLLDRIFHITAKAPSPTHPLSSPLFPHSPSPKYHPQTGPAPHPAYVTGGDKFLSLPPPGLFPFRKAMQTWVVSIETGAGLVKCIPSWESAYSVGW